jgi:hypothetical protein
MMAILTKIAMSPIKNAAQSVPAHGVCTTRLGLFQACSFSTVRSIAPSAPLHGIYNPLNNICEPEDNLWITSKFNLLLRRIGAIREFSAIQDYFLHGVPMINDPRKLRSSEDFSSVEYDVFEEMPNGSNVWRISVLGIENVEMKLLEFTGDTNRKFYAINLQNTAKPRIRTGSYPRQD